MWVLFICHSWSRLKVWADSTTLRQKDTNTHIRIHTINDLPCHWSLSCISKVKKLHMFNYGWHLPYVSYYLQKTPKHNLSHWKIPSYPKECLDLAARTLGLATRIQISDRKWNETKQNTNMSKNPYERQMTSLMSGWTQKKECHLFWSYDQLNTIK